MTLIDCAYVDSHRQVPLGGIVGTQPVCTSCADDLRELGFEVKRYHLVWRVKTRLPERKGQPCRVVARGRMNSALVEFEDGYRVVTSRNYVRRAG